MEVKSDQELILEYLQENNAKSLELLVSRYVTAVYDFSRTFVKSEEDTEDIVQETFVRAWKNLKKFDPEKKFKVWLFAIAKNAAIDHLRKKKTFAISSFDTEEGNAISDSLEDQAPLQDELFHRREIREKVEKAVKKLPEKYSAVIRLRHNEELTFEEIATIFSESLNTVKSRYRRGTLLLLDLLR